MSERDPVGRCRFCGFLYYTWKLPAHETVCCMSGRYTVISAMPFVQRELTEKQSKLLAELEKGPMRFTDLLRRRIYGNKGLAMALADLAVVGLVDQDTSQGYRLTEEGRKQTLRDRMVRAIDEMVVGLTYGQLEGRTRQLLLVIGRSG